MSNYQKEIKEHISLLRKIIKHFRYLFHKKESKNEKEKLKDVILNLEKIKINSNKISFLLFNEFQAVKPEDSKKIEILLDEIKKLKEKAFFKLKLFSTLEGFSKDQVQEKKVLKDFSKDEQTTIPSYKSSFLDNIKNFTDKFFDPKSVLPKKIFDPLEKFKFYEQEILKELRQIACEFDVSCKSEENFEKKSKKILINKLFETKPVLPKKKSDSFDESKIYEKDLLKELKQISCESEKDFASRSQKILSKEFSSWSEEKELELKTKNPELSDTQTILSKKSYKKRRFTRKNFHFPQNSKKNLSSLNKSKFYEQDILKELRQIASESEQDFASRSQKILSKEFSSCLKKGSQKKKSP